MRNVLAGLVAGALALFGASAAQAGDILSVSYDSILQGVALQFIDPNPTGTSTGTTASWDGGNMETTGGNSTASLPIMATPATLLVVTIMSGAALAVDSGGTVSGGVISGTALVKGGGGAATFVKIPIAAGAPGTVETGAYSIYVTVVGDAWGLDTVVATVSGTPALPDGFTQQTFTGNFGLNAGGAGEVLLVNAGVVTVSTFGAVTFSTSPSTLSLSYESPEPTMPLMAIAGAGLLVSFGAAKRYRS